jgi:hypothetical protein
MPGTGATRVGSTSSLTFQRAACPWLHGGGRGDRQEPGERHQASSGWAMECAGSVGGLVWIEAARR